MDSQWGDARAIQTRYDGHWFRSRIEARWAVFLNAAGVQWRYEAEGFNLGGVYYLPDFWLPRQGCFLEIKHTIPGDLGPEYREMATKAFRLAKHTGFDVFILEGRHVAMEHERRGAHWYAPDSLDQGDIRGRAMWATCLSCGEVGLADDSADYEEMADLEAIIGTTRPLSLICGHRAFGSTPKLEAAWVAAQTARFEHGAV